MSSFSNHSNSHNNQSHHHLGEKDVEKLFKQLLEQFRAFIAKKASQEETLKSLRTILNNSPSNASLIFDALVALQSEFDEERSCRRSSERADEIRTLFDKIGSEFLPHDVLSLELNSLGADDPQTKSKIVKSKTRIFYKQLKFNLLREESEGYAKLITELLHPSAPNNEPMILAVECLIGQFNLDPNRVLDIILECFEHLPQNKDQFVGLIRDFNVDRDDLLSILALKFLFCQNADHTPMSLYRISSLLAQEGLIDIIALFTLLSPSQKGILEEFKNLTDVVRNRSTRAETISSSGIGQLLAANESYPISSILNNGELGPEPSATVPAVSFSAAIQCQLSEDSKIAGNLFDDTVLYKKQKLGLLCALLEHGNWELAKHLLDRLPEMYPFGVCRRIAMALANIVGYKIESFYRLKYPHYRDDVGTRMKESWERFTCPLEQVYNWDAFFGETFQIAFQLGPYIGARHEVAIKLIRLVNIFYDDEDAQNLADFNTMQNAIVDLCDSVLVPAASLLESNYAYCEELWQILWRFSYQDRYRIYHRWRTVHTERCWDLMLQRGRVLGMTRYIMKRLSKDTAKVMGRQLGKLCHSYPAIPLDYLLSKVQDFQNFIGPVVESIRFLSSLEFDVLAYCLIENLAEPEKQDFKISDISYSPWLQSLANFAAAIFKRYTIDFGGILQYIANQLKDGKNMDLIVLREIVTSISGVESNTDLTQEHLEALCGGDTLRGEAGYLQMTKLNRRSINRLKEALLKNELFESLSILIGQQKQLIIYRDYKDYPLKLTTQMLDQCQETFNQFFHFLRTNLKPEEYSSRMPSASSLIMDYHLPVEAALYLTRPVYMHKIETSFEWMKKNLKESSGKNKLDGTQKTALYKEAFTAILNDLENELTPTFSEIYWLDLTSRLHTLFWLLSVNDLSAPLTAYERGIDKCKKELSELQTSAEIQSTSRGSQKRTAKDEERLKTLEQKLTDEMRIQTEHVKRVKEILSIEKEIFFAASQNKSSQMLRFLQNCILPRVISSEVDAVYCAKFVETLHTIKTGFFQTIVFLDKIFTDITPIIAGLSERETNCFGRFCCMLLDIILRWHSSKTIFEAECEGFPGCITKIRKKEIDDNAAADAFNYEFYRSICYKWQVRLTKSLGFMLTQQNYVLIRNALTMMLKILSNFPILVPLYKTIERNVTALRDNEKGKRHDLNLLASSYLVQLTKRNVKLWENNEFSDMKGAKAVGQKIGNGTMARKAVVAPGENKVSTSPTPQQKGQPEASTTQTTTTKRSRPPIRSAK